MRERERERGEIDPRLLLQSESTKSKVINRQLLIPYLLLTLYVWSFPVLRLTAQVDPVPVEGVQFQHIH